MSRKLGWILTNYRKNTSDVRRMFGSYNIIEVTAGKGRVDELLYVK